MKPEEKMLALASEGTQEKLSAQQLDRNNGWWTVEVGEDFGSIDESGDGGFEEHTARRIAYQCDSERMKLVADVIAAGRALLTANIYFHGLHTQSFDFSLSNAPGKASAAQLSDAIERYANAIAALDAYDREKGHD